MFRDTKDCTVLQHRPVVTLKNSKALPKYLFLSFKSFPNTWLVAILKALWFKPAAHICKTPTNQSKCIAHIFRNVTEYYSLGSSYCQRTQTRSSSRCINGPGFWISPWFWISTVLMKKVTQLNISIFMALKTQLFCCILISGAVQILHIAACCFE